MNISFSIFNQDHSEPPDGNIRAKCSINHTFKPNNFRGIQNLNQDEASMDMTLDESKLETSTCWNEKYQPITVGMTKDYYAVRYLLGLGSVIVPYSSPFNNLKMRIYPNVSKQDMTELAKLSEQQGNPRVIKLKKKT